MPKTRFVLVSLATLAFAAWTQPQGAASKPASTHAPVSAKVTNAGGLKLSAPPACPAAFYDSLVADGIVGTDRDGVRIPKAVSRPEAELSDEARKYIREQHIKNFKATARLSLVIDSNGNPQNPCLMKSAGHGLDAQAAKAVRQYKFAPATKAGKPVPMRIVLELNFKTY